jgi:hypothetical protein
MTGAQKFNEQTNTTVTVQNDDFYCTKWYLAVLLLTNPLPFTISSSVVIEIGVIQLLSSLKL